MITASNWTRAARKGPEAIRRSSMRKVLIILGVVMLLMVSASVGAVLLNRPDNDGHTEGLSTASEQDSAGLLRSTGLSSARSGPASASAPFASDEAAGQVDTLPPLGDKVIKTAEISIEVEKGRFQQRFDSAARVAEELGGYVTSSNSHESDERVSSGTIVLRVPSDKFQSALAGLKALGEVTGESTGGQDVTAEFVDLEARLRHLKSQEAFYLKLMDEAASVSDMIQIQSQLSSIQLQIEQHQGRLEQLKDQTSFATITARVFEPGAAFGGKARPLGDAWSQAVANFQQVVGGVIMAAGWLAPLAIMALAAFGIWRARRPKLA